MEQGNSFNHFLRSKDVDNNLRSLLYHLVRAVKYINFAIRTGNIGYLKGINSSGEKQLALDVLADQIICDELKRSQLVNLMASEEQEGACDSDGSRGDFAVAYDPLDGSSLVDANLAIGSIFGIWKGDNFLGQRGADMQAACYAVYGPRVIFTVALAGKGVHEFELNDVGEFILSRTNIQLRPTTKYMSPGALRSCNVNSAYHKLINKWIADGRVLRYSGGMVPDLNHILCKEEGVFSYPACDKHANGKLRLLFECAPFSLVFKEAGGSSKTQDGDDILSLKVTELHQRTTIVIGSRDEVDAVVKSLKG